MGAFIVGALSVLSNFLTLVSTSWNTIAAFIAPTTFFCLYLYLKKKRLIEHLSVASEMKHKASHLLRDKTYELMLISGQHADNNILLSQVTTELENTGREFVTLISELLTSLSGEQVNVCIKAIVNPRQIVQGTDDWKNILVYTLCRSPKSKPRPTKAPKHVPISENTDFLQIMENKFDVVAIPDLRKYDRDLRKVGVTEGYMNSTRNWYDFYNTTIVAPIRIDAARLKNSDAGYDFLGFLCADSLSTGAFPQRNISMYAQLMLSFGDDLYHYFNQATMITEKFVSETNTIRQTGDRSND